MHPFNARGQIHCAIFNAAIFNAAMSHTGFGKIMLTKDAGIESNSYFHYLHHKYFECNHGGTMAPFDQVFGTFQDGSAAAQEKMKKRMPDRLGGSA